MLELGEEVAEDAGVVFLDLDFLFLFPLCDRLDMGKRVFQVFLLPFSF